MTLPALLADKGADLVQVVMIILFVIIAAVGQLVAKVRQMARQQPAPRPPRPAAGRIQDEIDEFLRRASQRRAADRPVDALIVADEPKPALTAEVVEDTSNEAVGEGVVRQVRQYMDTSDFTRRASQLGEEVVQADEQFDQNVEQKFSHEVGRLSQRPGETASPPESVQESAVERLSPGLLVMTAANTTLAVALGDPDSICQAIVFNEILQRLPEDRWE
jgi:hypothetical protein